MTMIRKLKKAARRLTIGIGTLLCATSALVALAVLLAFLTQHSDELHALFSFRRMAAVGIALLLVAVSVLALEARRTRPIKRVLATAALLCAAGGAVLVWTGFDHPPSVESHDRSVAQGLPRSGSGWKPRHGGGKARRGNSHPHEDATPGSVKASDELSGESETEQAAASSSPYCSCYSSEGGYVPPQQESWSPEPSPEYGSSQSRSEESWGEEEWGEEESWGEEEWGEEESWGEEEEWGE